jgi:chemotaxis protein methyltransferase CheR
MAYTIEERALYDKFCHLIYDNCGIVFNEVNFAVLESRLTERCRLYEGMSLADYYKKVSHSDDELKLFLDAITTNLTRFFRNHTQYETLQHFTIPTLIDFKRRTGQLKHIKLWNTGCSTGEEAYTNAMCLQEWLPSDFTFQVVATDLSMRTLAIANDGYYSTERIADIPINLLAKYFTKLPSDGYRRNALLKSKVTFAYHNLNEAPYGYDYDIIFCRNVLIYFDDVVKNRVVNNFYHVMNNFSFLFLGHSESLFGMDTPLQFIRTEWGSLYGKNSN